jgi:hypothetical protein
MDQGLMILILFVVFGYFSMIGVQIWWKKRGELTANRFALLQIAYWSIFVILGLLADPISTENAFIALGLISIRPMGV